MRSETNGIENAMAHFNTLEEENEFKGLLLIISN